MSPNDAKSLEDAGWRLVTDDETLYNEFCTRRGFSLHKIDKIDIPHESLVYDFELMRGRRGLNGDMEVCLRRIAIDCFQNNFAGQLCKFIDVNHDCYEFVPDELVLDSSFEPWPTALLPGEAYVSLSEPRFSTGLFSNWGPELHLVVYGDPLVAIMKDCFPMTPVTRG